MTPEERIAQYLALVNGLAPIIAGLISLLRARGVSDEEIAAITADYDMRIARAEQEARGGV